MLDEDAAKPICQMCYWETVPLARARRCIDDKVLITCVGCGEAAAREKKHTIAPLNKSNYYYISSMETLRQLNPKRTT
jgi:hypothetical protein